MAVIVDRREQAGAGGKIRRNIRHDGGRRRALFKRQPVKERFQRRPGRTRRIRAIHLPGLRRKIITRTDQREDVAGLILDDHNRAFAGVFGLQEAKLMAKGLPGEPIEAQVQRGADAGISQPPPLPVPTVDPQNAALQRRGRPEPAATAHAKRAGIHLQSADPPAHARENPYLAAAGGGEMRARIQSRRGLRQPGQQRAFGRAEIAQRFGEIELGRRHAAAVVIAVIHPVQILGQNPLLVPDLLQAQRLRCLDDFGLERSRPGRAQLDRLLRDGGSAGDDAPVPNQLPGGAQVRPPIHAVMAPEPAVLRRQRGADQRLGDFRQGRELLEGTVAVAGQAQRLAVPVQQLDRRRRSCEQGRRQGDEGNQDWLHQHP